MVSKNIHFKKFLQHWQLIFLTTCFKGLSVEQRSTRQVCHLVACRSILCQLFAQDWPNLRWGWLNNVEVDSINALQVTVLKHYKREILTLNKSVINYLPKCTYHLLYISSFIKSMNFLSVTCLILRSISRVEYMLSVLKNCGVLFSLLWWRHYLKLKQSQTHLSSNPHL